MSKKETFIAEIEVILSDGVVLSEDAMTYFTALKGAADKEKPAFTENGKAVLQFIKKNKEIYNNLFKAKEIGEGMGTTSKKVSGAMRKLVTDGFLEKIGENPVTYSLTKLGESVSLDEE